MKRLISFLCVLAGIAAASAQAQYLADYDPASNILALPWVKVGNDYYGNVVLSIPPGQAWSLVRFGERMANVPSQTAVYDAVSSLLTIPAVSVQSGSSASSRKYATTRTSSAGTGAPTLVGGVEVSLANGHWGVLRAGTSVTTSNDIDPILGRIIDRFSVPCKTESGTTTCTNDGFTADQTFGIDIDADGDEDQVWKVDSSSQCPAVQAAVWDSFPPDSDTFLGDDASEMRTVEAHIYAHPNGVYIMRYGSGGTWLSCTVHPVTGVSSVVQNPSGSLTVSSADLTGEVGSVLNFFVLGGTPPYTVVSENETLATVSLGSATGNQGQLVSLTLNTTGPSGSATATTNVFVFDWYQQTASIPVTIKGGSTSSTLSVSPSSVDFIVGTRFTFEVSGGVAPYTVFNPLSLYIQVSPVSGSSTKFEVYLASFPEGGDSLWGGFSITDSSSQPKTAWLPITVSDNPAMSTDMTSSESTLSLASETWRMFTISGGSLPLTAYNPNSDWFTVEQLNDRLFRVKLNAGAVSGIDPCNSSLGSQLLYVTSTDGRYVGVTLKPRLYCTNLGDYGG